MARIATWLLQGEQERLDCGLERGVALDGARSRQDGMNLDRLATECKSSVYRQMVRSARNRKNSQTDLLLALFDAYLVLDQLDEVKGYREWLLRTTQICLNYFPDGSVIRSMEKARQVSSRSKLNG